MIQPIAIRILERESNKRGDLFGRLMSDLFLSLGYEEPRLNIHRTGREVDIEATHRTESRMAIAECKAEKTKSGGDAINKFVGSLDVERRKHPDAEITGYFVALTGFAETTREQETEAGGDRVVLLDGAQVVTELIKGRILSDKLLPLLFSGDVHREFAACWALAWIGNVGHWRTPTEPNVLRRLLDMWRNNSSIEVQRAAAWAMNALPLLSRDANPFAGVEDLVDFVREQYEQRQKRSHAFVQGAFVIAYYIGVPWTDAELAELVAGEAKKWPWDNGKNLLTKLGRPGQLEFEKLEKEAKT